MTQKKPKLIVNFSMCIISIALILFIAEGVMRLYSKKNPYFLNKFKVNLNKWGFTQYDPVLGYCYKPNSQYSYYRADNFDNKLVFNNVGFHDYDFSKRKIDDSYRIAIVGDSFVACSEVPISKKWTHILENELNRISKKKNRNLFFWYSRILLFLFERPDF